MSVLGDWCLEVGLGQCLETGVLRLVWASAWRLVS